MNLQGYVKEQKEMSWPNLEHALEKYVKCISRKIRRGDGHPLKKA